MIGCAIATGYGAALNTAKVRPGSTVAIWGLGGVGLAAAMGAKKAGAARIIGVDINPAKAELGKNNIMANSIKQIFEYFFITGKIFGITEYINPKDHEEPVEQVLFKMTNGGVDHALECCGIPACMVKLHLSNVRFRPFKSEFETTEIGIRGVQRRWQCSYVSRIGPTHRRRWIQYF